MSPSNINIKYLESLVTGIKEITGCRIVTDSAGEIAEIHVTAESERPPRLIARDVDTLLQVKAGLDIDYRKIGVAVSQPGSSAAAADIGEAEETGAELGDREPSAPPVEAEFGSDEEAEDLIVEDLSLEDRPRVLFERIALDHSEGRVRAEVTLRVGLRRATGESDSVDTGEGSLAVVVQATLEAVLLLFAPGMEFSPARFEILPFGREEVLVVFLSALEGRLMQTYAGSAVIRQDRQQAAVLATLSALNRVIPLWPERDARDFEIL
jgi:hypothetical protein